MLDLVVILPLIAKGFLSLGIGSRIGLLLSMGWRFLTKRQQKYKFNYAYEKELNFSPSHLLEDLLANIERELEKDLDAPNIILNLLQQETFYQLNRKQFNLAKLSLLELAQEKRASLSMSDLIDVWKDTPALKIFARAIQQRFFARLTTFP